MKKNPKKIKKYIKNVSPMNRFCDPVSIYEIIEYLMNKKNNFIGSQVLREKLQSGVDIKIVYLEIDVDDADARGNEPVYHNNKIVGVVTSGGYGFRVNKSLAFAYVKSDLTEMSKEFEVQIQGQKRRAIVLKEMAYDPENKKLNS